MARPFFCPTVLFDILAQGRIHTSSGLLDDPCYPSYAVG